MRLLLVVALLGILFVGSPASTSPKSTPEQTETSGMPRVGRSGRQSEWPEWTPIRRLAFPEGASRLTREMGQSMRSQKEQPDISRSGRDFLEVCSNVGIERGIDSEGNRDAARVSRDATCLGWVAGFAEGFLVHDELLGVPRRDRLACLPRGVTTIQIVRVIKKYLTDNPEKAHRATRYMASLALAGTFSCRAGK